MSENNNNVHINNVAKESLNSPPKEFPKSNFNSLGNELSSSEEEIVLLSLLMREKQYVTIKKTDPTPLNTIATILM